jgi:hypothetical protein
MTNIEDKCVVGQCRITIFIIVGIFSRAEIHQQLCAVAMEDNLLSFIMSERSA